MSVDQHVTSQRLTGLTPILIATAIAGATGYVIQFVVPLAIPPAEYLRFSVFWAAIYLVISGLSGIQQEVSRASSPRAVDSLEKETNSRRFTIATILSVAICAPVSALLWGRWVFPEDTWTFVAALSLGSASYVLVAVLSGLLYGLNAWTVIAAQTVLDAIFRLVFVVLGVMVGAEVSVLVWAIVVPFPLTVLCVWAFARRRVRGRYILDVSAGRLGWNSGRTVLGATATGVLISGFPLLLDATSKGESQSAVGVLVLAITLTRAPLVIPLLALQSFLTVFFRDRRDRSLRVVMQVLGIVAAVTSVVSLLAYFIGPALFVTVFGENYAIGAGVTAAIVASAGLTAGLCVTGPAVLALGNHAVFLYGWVAAALTLFMVLLLPLNLVPRTVGALVIGPFVGLAIHLLALACAAREIRAEDRGVRTPQ